MPNALGTCAHYEEAEVHERFRIKHPGATMEHDCDYYYECCEVCKIKVIAALYDEYNSFINGEEAVVMECAGDGGHRYLSPMQFYIAVEEDEE